MGLFRKKKPKIESLPEFPKLKESFPSYEPQLPRVEKPSPPITPKFRFPETKPVFEEPTFRQKPVSGPLFVKIDKYKAAVKTIDDIKARLNEAEKILRNLNKINDEEQHELSEWQHDITEIKEKLLKVDKDLFEA